MSFAPTGSPGRKDDIIMDSTGGTGACRTGIKQCIAQKLKEVIEAHKLPLGSTEEGMAWCIKALHPSDPATMVRGIPDHSSIPSVFMNYQSTQTINAPAVAKPWEADITLIPNPVVLSAIMTATSDGVTTAFSNHFNPQLAGATLTDRYSSWKAMAQRWRLAYASATIYQDSSALANQGTVVVAQYEMCPRKFCGTFAQTIDVAKAVAPNHFAYLPIASYDERDWARGETAQSMPSAYFGNSRDGAYVPLKLNETCQRWMSEADDVMHGGLILNTPPGTGPYADTNVYIAANIGDPSAPTAIVKNVQFPYWDTAAAGAFLASIPVIGTDGTSFGIHEPGRQVPGMTTNVAVASFRNLDPSARITIFYRYGWELQVQPGTVLSPQQQLSPRYDAVALDSYFAISRDMKDAYPADYNDLGKIWDVISTIGHSVLPVVQGISPAVGGIVGAGLGFGDKMRQANLKKIAKGLEAGKNPPSPADAKSAAQALQTVTSAAIAEASNRMTGRRGSGARRNRKSKSKKQNTKKSGSKGPSDRDVAAAAKVLKIVRASGVRL